MIHVGEKIKVALDQMGIKYKIVAKQLGMTDGNLQKIFRKEKIDTELLYRFSKLTGKPIGWFLDENAIISEPVTKHSKSYNDQSITNHDDSTKVTLKIEIELHGSQLQNANKIREKIIKLLND